MKGYFRKRGCKCEGKRCTCDATWSFTLDIGRDPLTGKRIQKQMGGFKTKKEAQAACAAMQTELAEGTYIAEKEMLFSTLVEEWLKLYETTVKISTVRVRKHEASRLLDYFKNHLVKNITRKAYQNALLDLYERGFALNTIAGIHSTGRMLFTKAIELEIIKNDPTQYAKLPRPQKTVEEIEAEESEVKYLEKHELAKLLKTAKEKGLVNDYVIFLTLAYSGLRVGELCALKWNDFDFKDRTLSVTKTYYNPTNRATEYHLLTPKTSTSKRTIELDPLVFKELEKLKARQNELKMLHRDVYYDQDFVFAKTENDMGYPEFIKTIQNRMRRLLRLAGLNETLTPHSLRHTHTSLLSEAGVGIHDIMEKLGHQDDEITKRVYLHVTKTMKKEAAQRFSELMEGL